MAHALIFES